MYSSNWLGFNSLSVIPSQKSCCHWADIPWKLLGGHLKSLLKAAPLVLQPLHIHVSGFFFPEESIVASYRVTSAPATPGALMTRSCVSIKDVVDGGLTWRADLHRHLCRSSQPCKTTIHNIFHQTTHCSHNARLGTASAMAKGCRLVENSPGDSFCLDTGKETSGIAASSAAGASCN